MNGILASGDAHTRPGPHLSGWNPQRARCAAGRRDIASADRRGRCHRIVALFNETLWLLLDGVIGGVVQGIEATCAIRDAEWDCEPYRVSALGGS